jgi:hypothetical protein
MDFTPFVTSIEKALEQFWLELAENSKALDNFSSSSLHFRYLPSIMQWLASVEKFSFITSQGKSSSSLQERSAWISFVKLCSSPVKLPAPLQLSYYCYSNSRWWAALTCTLRKSASSPLISLTFCLNNIISAAAADTPFFPSFLQ